MKFFFALIFPVLMFLCQQEFCNAQELDLSKSQIYNAVDKSQSLRSVEILLQEVEKRTGIELPLVNKIPKKGGALILLALENDLRSLSVGQRGAVSAMSDIKQEGFKILVLKEEKTLLLIGKDSRGLLYGIGRLLRKLRMSHGEIGLSDHFAIATSPRYPVRGHQLGYRPKTNAYDAFSVAQFDQYIRELALFGANHIEILPPRTDDDFTSPHMKIPAIKMIAEQSRICKKYGLDVSIWYPNMGADYVNPDSVRKELKEREEVFSTLSKLNEVFVPGGDPGYLEPDVLFAWLEKEAEVLRKYHPQAKIWVSPQVFRPTQKWFDRFFEHVNREYPWFGGVVFGPWVKMPVEDIRRLVKPSIPIRHYPDITHNYSAQYPVPHWDLAFAMTLGRESINPRPYDEKAIHNAFDEFAVGSISYSEGTNDDVNKFVWSDQDWDPDTPVIETLRDYARLFINGVSTESFVQGILGLERNWKGEVLTNDGIDRTLFQWQDMERHAPSVVLRNPRFQMGLIRAYFDSYTRERLKYETELEDSARRILASATLETSLPSINCAKAILEKAWKEPILPAYQAKCRDLADSLFKSIGAQLTMKKHGAMSGRGNFVDLINMPLNDSPWWLDQMQKVENLSSAIERVAKINEMLHRTDPGPGGFYDHFGDPESWSRVVPNLPWEKDPGSLRSPRIGFGVGLVGEEWVHEIKATGFKGQVTPKAWMKQAKTLYDQPLKIHYDDLDVTSFYKIRIAYIGRFRSKMKMTTDKGILIHDFIQTGETPIYEFDLPAAAYSDGKVTFEWNCGEGERGSQVTEIWLIRKGN